MVAFRSRFTNNLLFSMVELHHSNHKTVHPYFLECACYKSVFGDHVNITPIFHAFEMTRQRKNVR